MSTIFPAPGTITSSNSYIVDWYINEPSFLRYPTIVTQRADTFSAPVEIPTSNNLDTYENPLIGEYAYTIRAQSLPSATTLVASVGWYEFDQNVLSYTTTQAATITLYFDNQFEEYIPFKKSSTIRIINSIIGYNSSFTVLASTYDSVTIDYVNITLAGGTIDSKVDTVYRQSQIVPTFNTTSISQKNLFYSRLSRPLINVNFTHTGELPKINKLSASLVVKSVTDERPPTPIKQFKTSVIPDTNIQSNVISLSQFDSLVAGDYSFDVTNQTLIYSTVNTSTVNWYLNESNIITYNNRTSNVISIFFNNTSSFIPFKTSSTIRISTKYNTYSKTFTVLAGYKDYVIIESDVFNAYGAVIDNIKSTVAYQDNTFREISIANLPRANLFYSVMARGFKQSSITPSAYLTSTTNQFAPSVMRSVTVLNSITNPTTPTTITKFKVNEVVTYSADTDIKQLNQYNSSIEGEYHYKITNQSLPTATTNTNTINWYSLDASLLTYSISNAPTINIFFDNNSMFIPFRTGSTIRITNSLTGYSKLFTVIVGRPMSVTIETDVFVAEGAYIDGIVNSVYSQDRTNQEYSISSIPRKNMMYSLMSPNSKPSITFSILDYTIAKDMFTAETLDKPLLRLTNDNTKISSDVINKLNTKVTDSNTIIDTDTLEIHTAPLYGEYAFSIIETRPLRFKTVNTTTVNWYTYEQNTLTYTTNEYVGNITIYFNNPYTAFIPFRSGSTVKISDSNNFSATYTVLTSTINSITIPSADIPFNSTIDNITETVYNQTYTFLALPNVSEPSKKLYYSQMASGFTAPKLDAFDTSITEVNLTSGKISKELAPVTAVATNIESSSISKPTFSVKPVIPTIKSEIVDKFRANDVTSSSVDIPRFLTPYDSLEDETTVGVLGQPIEYNVINWYLNETNILTKSFVNKPSITLIFENSKIWKIFLVNQYVRIKQPAVNFTADVLVTSVTLNSITFDSVVGFPTNYSGMTISHLYSPVYSQSLVNVDINPPNLALPRENLAASTNSMFINMFPIGKTIYNSRGTFAISNPKVHYDTIQLPSNISLINSNDSVPDGSKFTVMGQPIQYNVVNWYAKEFDNRLIGTQVTPTTSITLVFEYSGVNKPFKVNEIVRIQQLNSTYSVDVTITSASVNSITFNKVDGFPTNYSGLQLIRLYSSVLPQLTFDQAFPTINNPTNLDKPQQNLSLLSNTAFFNLFPIGKMYNLRGTSDFSLTPQLGSTSIDTPKFLTPYETIEDGLMTDVIGQPIYYNVVDWYINDSDRLLGSAVSLPTITLIYTYLGTENPFIGPQLVRIKQASTNYSVDVMITRSTANSITFDTIPGFPTNYSGLTIYRLNSPIFSQKDVHVEFNPYNLTLPRENLAASLLKPNINGSYVTFYKNELLGDIITSDTRGRMEVFDEFKIPGDFDCPVTSISLYSYTASTATAAWYTFDNDILPYTIQTSNYIKLQFKELEFIPFKTNTNVKLVSTTRMITTVITGTTSYIIVEYTPDFVWDNMRVQQDVSPVYPLDYASTTVSPVTPRERLYFTRISATVPLSVVFNQGDFVNTDVPSVKTPIFSLRTVEPNRRVSAVKLLPKIAGVPITLNTQLLNKYQSETSEVKSSLPIDLLSNVSVVEGESANWNSGLLNKFSVSKISEIGRETVVTVSKIIPIQFWN